MNWWVFRTEILGVGHIHAAAQAPWGVSRPRPTGIIIEYKAAPRCGAFAAREHFTGSKRRRPAVDDLNSMDTGCCLTLVKWETAFAGFGAISRPRGGTNTSDAGGLYLNEAGGLTVL
jgi:hypothetical protein